MQQDGRYLSGREHDEVVEAVMKDRTHLDIDGHHVEILEVKITEIDGAVVKVKVD